MSNLSCRKLNKFKLIADVIVKRHTRIKYYDKTANKREPRRCPNMWQADAVPSTNPPRESYVVGRNTLSTQC